MLTVSDAPLQRAAPTRCKASRAKARPTHEWLPGEEDDEMKAWVVLPHCMQTSGRFWERVGFDLVRVCVG